MKAISTFLFVIALSLNSFAVEASNVRPELCLGGDKACQPVPANQVETEAAAAVQGPQRKEAIGGKAACAACIAENAQKNGKKGGIQETPADEVNRSQ